MNNELAPVAPVQVSAVAHDLSPAARAAIAAGMPDSTRRGYLGDLERFWQWRGVRDTPADAAVLTEYATHLAYDLGLTPASIERARWAICKWHKLAGYPPPATDGLVAVLKGYRQQLALGKSPKAAPRRATPVGRDSLTAMLALIDRDTPAGCRDAALLLCGFSIGGRRSEIAALDISSIDLRTEGMQITVYRRKTRTLDDPVVKYRQNAALCPVRAMVAWLEMLAAHGRTSGPLFVRIDRHGHLAPHLTRHGEEIGDSSGRITGQAVAHIVRRRMRAAGLSGRGSGHSLRRGLATEMARAKADRRAIERQGGWTEGSRAVSGYIDDADRWLEDVLDGVL